MTMKLDDLYETVMPSEVDPLDSVTETAAGGLAILAERGEQLVQLCERLFQENQSLREQQQDLRAKCEQLHEKNELSRSRIEAMVVRLRSLEQTP